MQLKVFSYLWPFSSPSNWLVNYTFLLFQITKLLQTLLKSLFHFIYRHTPFIAFTLIHFADTAFSYKLKVFGICSFHVSVSHLSFPDSSVGKESACNAEDPGLIPGLGRPAGEGIGYPLKYSWAFLVVQLVKNLPAKKEIWVWSLGWKDPLEKGKATHFSILAWRIPWTV